jgi:hypothetical protein
MFFLYSLMFNDKKLTNDFIILVQYILHDEN